MAEDTLIGGVVEGADSAEDILANIESVIAGLAADETEGGDGATNSLAQKTGEPETGVPEAKAQEVVDPPKADEKAGNPPPEPKVDTAEDEKVKRGFERLAARMAEVEAKEKALEERSRSLGSVVSQLRRGQVNEAFKALGVSDEEVPKLIRIAMATQLPADKVPAQYKQMQEQLVLDERFREQQSEVVKLREELKRRDEAAAAAQARAQYVAQLDSFLGSATEVTPTLAKLAATNKDKARDRVMAVVAADAQKKAAQYEAGLLKAEDAVPMSPAEAAKIVEAELAEYAALFTSAGDDSKTQAKTQPKGKPTLSNRATQPAATRPSSGQDVPTDLVDEVDNWLRANGLA